MMSSIEERLTNIEKMLGLKRSPHFPAKMKLSQTHERFLRMLISTSELTQEAAYAGLYGNKRQSPESYNVLSVHISKIRKALRPLHIKIKTVHGVGWTMAAEDRTKLRGLLA